MIMPNLFAAVPASLPEELIEVLLQTANLRIERIVSRGHVTPPGQWYDQETGEWVILLQGSADLRIDGQADVLHLQPGDFVHLPPHLRHRVEWTDPAQDSIWLAIHY
jgi:cupin 2 domain-containing protein